MTDIDRRTVALESLTDRILIVLEGEPIYDISKKNIVDHSGGMVTLVEQSAEQLVLIENRLGRIETRMIETQISTTRPPWTRGQKVTLFSVGAPLTIGLLSSFWTTVVTVATWIVRL